MVVRCVGDLIKIGTNERELQGSFKEKGVTQSTLAAKRMCRTIRRCQIHSSCLWSFTYASVHAGRIPTGCADRRKRTVISNFILRNLSTCVKGKCLLPDTTRLTEDGLSGPLPLARRLRTNCGILDSESTPPLLWKTRATVSPESNKSEGFPV